MWLKIINSFIKEEDDIIVFHFNMYPTPPSVQVNKPFASERKI